MITFQLTDMEPVTVDDGLAFTADDSADAEVCAALADSVLAAAPIGYLPDRAGFAVRGMIARVGGSILSETDPAYFSDPPGVVY